MPYFLDLGEIASASPRNDGTITIKRKGCRRFPGSNPLDNRPQLNQQAISQYLGVEPGQNTQEGV
jgi:hypothetical protein